MNIENLDFGSKEREMAFNKYMNAPVGSTKEKTALKKWRNLMGIKDGGGEITFLSDIASLGIVAGFFLSIISIFFPSSSFSLVEVLMVVSIIAVIFG